MTHRQAFTATVGHAEQQARGRRCRPAGRVLRAILGRAVPALAAVAFLTATAPDLAAQVEVEEPKVTIAAERSSHGFGIDDVVFDLTRSGPKDVVISVQLSLVQADLYLAEGELNRVVEFAADATAAELRIGASLFDGPATESGVLSATLVDASGYRVGRPNSAQTRMLVKDPAITVRPERASYSIDEDDGEVRVTFIARTASDLPRPGKAFSIAVSSKAGDDDAVARAEIGALSQTIDFRPRDFAADDGEWEARKTVSISMVEGARGLDVKYQRAASTPERIRPRNSDGSACTDDVCMVPVIMTQREEPTLTIAAGSSTYGYRIDDVAFTVTRTEPIESEISGSVTMTQDDTYLLAESLSWTFTIPANETTATHTIGWERFTGGATLSGDLTATIDAGNGYTVGMPGAATVKMVVLDPAITVRPEKADYSFDEDDTAAKVVFIARTAPDLPRPNVSFSVSVSTVGRTDGAGPPDDYAKVAKAVEFEPNSFKASDSEWEARKEVALTIVDDGETEGDEIFDLKLERSAGLPNRITWRQADGSVCPDGGCTVPVTILDNDTLTIAASQQSYAFGIDDVVFTVTRNGTAEEEISGTVALAQDEAFLGTGSLRWDFSIAADETTTGMMAADEKSTDIVISAALFDGDATQSGDLTATIEAGDGYTVGMPGAATVKMVVADPAITVRPQHAAYSFDEDDTAARVVFIARTAPDLPQPSTGFTVTVSSRPRADGAGSPDDYALVSEEIAFQPDDFTASGGEWEARKEIAFTIVDDDETEGDETFDLELGKAPGLPAWVELRQADGSTCAGDVCTVPVTIAANDGPALERIVISPVPPEATADHGPFYRKDDFLAVPEGAVHGRGATLTFTLNLDTEVTVTGAPELVLDIYDREHRARYTGGSGTAQLTFTWTVAKGDNDPDGLEFRFLDLNGGTIRDGEDRDLLQDTLPAQRFAEHRVRGGLFAMRLEVSGSAREGEPFEIRVVRNGGYDEPAVAVVDVTDSALPHVPQLFTPALNGPGVRQFDFHDGGPGEPGVRTSTRTVTPPGDGTTDESRTLTLQLAITDAGIDRHTGQSIRAWYLAEEPLEVTVPVIDTGQALAEAGLRVHETSTTEAPGAKLVFRVSLSPRSDSPVTVEYRTGDDPANESNAIAGEDYEATEGILIIGTNLRARRDPEDRRGRRACRRP